MEKHEIELLLNKVCEIKREGCYAPCSTLILRETEHSYFYTIRDFFRGGAWLTLACSRGKGCRGCPMSSPEKLLELAQRYISPVTRDFVIRVISLTQDTMCLTVLEIQKYKPWRQKFITILEGVLEALPPSSTHSSSERLLTADTGATPNTGTEVRDVCEVVWEERNPNLQAAKIRLYLYNMTIDNALKHVSISLDRSEVPYNFIITVNHSYASAFLAAAGKEKGSSAVTNALKLSDYRRVVGKALFVEQQSRIKERQKSERSEQRERNE